MQSKKAFTLVEVLVSLMLLSTIGIILLQTNSNSIHNFTYIKDRMDFEKIISLASIEYEEKFYRKKPSLYTLVEDDFIIQNDELIRKLKTMYIFFDRKPKKFINNPINTTDSTLDEIIVTTDDKKSVFSTLVLGE